MRGDINTLHSTNNWTYLYHDFINFHTWNRLDVCYNSFYSKIPKYDLNKRQYLSVLYTLAKIDVMNGDIEQAVIKLQKVVKHGNKLYIVNESQEMLENLITE